MKHPTKEKGDLGVAKAHADLVVKGFIVLFPATEHAPFDLAAYREGSFFRIQVKYRASRKGMIEMPFKSNRASKPRTRWVDKSAIDVFCIYCPDTDQCYYLRPKDFGLCVNLRLKPAQNNQQKGIRFASDYREMPTLQVASEGVEKTIDRKL